MVFSGKVDDAGRISLQANGRVIQGAVDSLGNISLGRVRDWGRISNDGRIIVHGAVVGRVDLLRNLTLFSGTLIPS